MQLKQLIANLATDTTYPVHCVRTLFCFSVESSSQLESSVMPKPSKCLTRALPEISVALALLRVCGWLAGGAGFWRLAGRRPALCPATAHLS